MAGRRHQAGDIDPQPPFGHGRDIRKLNAHAFPVRSPHDPFERNVLFPSAECEDYLRANREGIRIDNENALQAQVPDCRGSYTVVDTIARFGFKPWRRSSIFVGHRLNPRELPGSNDIGRLGVYRRKDCLYKYKSSCPAAARRNQTRVSYSKSERNGFNQIRFSVRPETIQVLFFVKGES